jgi:hypothetical protein
MHTNQLYNLLYVLEGKIQFDRECVVGQLILGLENGIRNFKAEALVLRLRMSEG